MSAITSAWSALTGFLAKHVGDLNALATALTTINTALPIDQQDKSNIAAAIEAVQTSADNINNWLQNASTAGGDVVVKESDIVAAVAAYVTSEAGVAQLRSALGVGTAPSTEGNGNA